MKQVPEAIRSIPKPPATVPHNRPAHSILPLGPSGSSAPAFIGPKSHGARAAQDYAAPCVRQSAGSQSNVLLRRSTMNRFLAVMIVLSLMICAGCSNLGQEKTASSLKDTRAAVVKAQSDVNYTVSALDALGNSQGDLKPAYARFQTALASTRQQKKIAEDRASDMRRNEATYQKKWESETAILNNPDVKSSADQRIAERRAKYDDMREVAL